MAKSREHWAVVASIGPVSIGKGQRAVGSVGLAAWGRVAQIGSCSLFVFSCPLQSDACECVCARARVCTRGKACMWQEHVHLNRVSSQSDGSGDLHPIIDLLHMLHVHFLPLHTSTKNQYSIVVYRTCMHLQASLQSKDLAMTVLMALSR